MADFTFSALTPTSYLARAAHVLADRPAVVDGDVRLSYAEFGERSQRLAGALAGLGVAEGDRVAALCTNSHVMLEAHHGVPWAGAVLVPMNTRLSVRELAYIVEHSGARVLLATHEPASTAREVVASVDGVRLVVAGGRDDEYEALLAGAAPLQLSCSDERGLLAINYTSGTTGSPKGVMYHHRGAALQALAMAFHSGLGQADRYLWTLPMFHCDGWCFPWAVTAAGATHVCLRAIDADEIWRLIREEGVTAFCAAPTVLTMIASAAGDGPLPEKPVWVATGGAPPSPTLLSTMAELRMSVTHLYGLTETYGPVAINDWQPQWDALPGDEQAALQARQGVGNVIAERLRVVRDDGEDVSADGSEIGELVARGNDVMLGYYRDEDTTAAVTTVDGWFRTGDLGVVHPDGYVEIRDRSKDLIISGGENIASVEIERVLDSHPAVLESAVVGEAHEKWGEVPVAYVTLRGDGTVGEDELIEFVRGELARFKAPRRVVFAELPKTSTGKIQKNVLREQGA